MIIQIKLNDKTYTEEVYDEKDILKFIEEKLSKVLYDQQFKHDNKDINIKIRNNNEDSN